MSVKRDCQCIERTYSWWPHVEVCRLSYRAKFFDSWRQVRQEFYTKNPPIVDGSMN